MRRAHRRFFPAGHELGVTSATVSQQVRNPEDWLNCILRRANRIRLTDAGRDYYMNAATTLADIAGFTQALSEGDAHRPLVISATPALAALWVPPRLARFAEQRPDMSIRLRIEGDEVVLEPAGIDARLTYGVGHPEYRTQLLFSDHLVPVAAQSGTDPAAARLISVDWGQ